MANLLRWSVGMALPKKKDENTPLISFLRTLTPTITRTVATTNTNNAATNSNNTNTTTSSFTNMLNRTQQINDQIRQQAEQRRQQEQERQQRLAEQQRQQEQRKQQEAQRKLQQQQAQQQKQQKLLSSAGLSTGLFGTTDLRASLEAQKQARLQREQQAAAKKLQQQTQATTTSSTIDDNLRTKYNNLFKDEGNGWSNNSFWTSYRDNGSKAYKYNPVYWESQQDLNRALRTIMSKDDNALGDADRIVSAYNKLSNDEKWSAYQDLQKAANKIQQVMAKADNEGNTAARDSYGQALDYINTYQNLISGIDKGEKSFWKSLTDTAQSGGFIGDMAQPFVNALGDLTGRSDVSKRIENDNSTAKAGNNGAVSALDKLAGMVGNVGLNVTTAGKYGLGTSAMNLAHEGVSAVNDQDRQYYVDANGNVQRQNATNEQKFSSIGSAGFNLGMSVLGMKGLGPNIKFSGGQTLQGLVSSGQYGELAKGLLKYAGKELPFAAGTTLGETLIQSVGNGKEAWNNYGENLINNIIGDLSMDVAGAMKYGQTGERDLFRVNQDNGKLELDDSVKSKLSAEDNAKVQQRLDDFQEGVKQAFEQEGRADLSKVDSDIDLSKVQTNDDGSMVKVNDNGTKTRLSDSELSKVIEQESSRPTVTGQNPFIDNSVKITSSSNDVEALTKLAAQGNEYAKQRLAELTKGNEAPEDTGWQRKTVDEVINPERAAEDEIARSERVEDINPTKTNNGEQNAPQEVAESVNDKPFSRMTPSEQSEWFRNNAETVPSETQLAESLRKMGIDPNGMSHLDMLREYTRATENPMTRAMSQDEVDNTPRVSSSERDAYGEAADRAEIEGYYKRYGEDFYEKMPEDLQAKYEDMLSMQARDENGVYKDPITGEEWIDQTSVNVSDDIDDVLSNPNRKQPVKLRDNTPEALVGLGIKDLPMYENPSHVRNNILTESEAKNAGVFRNGDNYHGLGKDVFMEAIDGLDVPRAVFKRNDGSNDFLILTSAKDGNGNTVIVPVQIQTTTNANYMDIDTNRVKTVFGYDDKAGLNQYIKNNIKKGEFTKIDPGEAVIAASAGSNESVSQNGSKVNANDPLVQYYRKYGDDFYDKLPENLKNRYEDMLDSQPRDGNGRYTDPITGETWIDSTAREKSQFAENTSSNKRFSDETRTELKSDPLTYKPTTNEERLARANEILSTKSSDEIDNYLRENFFNVKPKDADSADMVLAGEYAKMLDAKGQYDRSTEIINRMSEIGTKQGQNIQALSLMMNRSPEGIANMAQTAIKKGGGEMTPEIRGEIVSKTQEIGRTRGERAKLESENAKLTEQIMNGEGDLSALRKRQMQLGQAYRLNLDQEGRQFSQLSDIVSKNSPDKRNVFGSIWRAGLLSGPRTHTGNAVSNTFQNILNAGSDRIAAGLDWARSKITGKERQVVTSAGGRGEGLKRGLKAAGEVLKTGNNLWESTDTILGKTDAWGQGGELEFKNKIANNMVAKPTNYVFRAMSAGDLPFRYSAFENAIRTEAKRQGINQGYKGQALQDYINSRVATPDPELQAYGIRKGNESVYDMDTMLSKMVTAIDQGVGSKIENPIGRKAYDTAKTLIMPFVKVPSKVLSTAIDYSPMGAVKALVSKVGSKNYTTGQFETDLAKSGLGTTGFVGLGYALSAAGLLTGGYPEDQEERNRWKAEGIEPNSIKIGDKYLSLNYLGPASMLMSMGSGVQKRQAEGQDANEIIGGTLMDTLNTFLDQSYVQGLNNVVQAITDSNRYGESFTNNLARGLVPNLLRQTAVATDPKQRQTNNAGDAIISGIPGLSQTLDAKVDVYGREIENKQTLPLGQAWDALKLNNSRETNDVIDEVNRLHNVDPNNKDLQVTPPTQNNNISVNGTNIKLTDAQKTQLQKDVGEAAVIAMRQVMQSSEYAGLSDIEKAKALDKARSNAQTQARKQFIEANNITADNNPETRNSGGNVDGEYANKAISSATSSGSGRSAITVNDSLNQASKDVLKKYNSMSSDDWNDYIYGTSADSAAAEYNLAKAKYENDLANGKLTEPQRIKREKELAKLAVSQKWTKDYRDAYSLAGTKADMQAFLNELDDATRAQTVATLNGLNNAMYEAGIITASTYKTRYNAINNTTSSKSSGRKSSKKSSDGISSAEASALASLAKTMVNNTNTGSKKTTSAPTTNRKMARTKSGGNSSGLKTYSTNLAKNATVSKGANRSIA